MTKQGAYEYLQATKRKRWSLVIILLISLLIVAYITMIVAEIMIKKSYDLIFRNFIYLAAVIAYGYIDYEEIQKYKKYRKRIKQVNDMPYVVALSRYFNPDRETKDLFVLYFKTDVPNISKGQIVNAMTQYGIMKFMFVEYVDTDKIKPFKNPMPLYDVDTNE